MTQENKIEELTKLINGFLTEVLPGGCWQTYTEPKKLAAEIVKNLGLFSVVFNEAETVCKICHKPKRMQNGILQLLCECPSEVEVCAKGHNMRRHWCVDCDLFDTCEFE